jgi:hypothetical protein
MDTGRAELLHTDRQTDRQTSITKLILTSFFLSFANVPKMQVNHNQVVQKNKPSELISVLYLGQCPVVK